MAIEIFDGVPGPLSYDTFYFQQTNQSYLCYINYRYFYVRDLTPSFHLIQSIPLTTFLNENLTEVSESYIVLSAHKTKANIAVAIGKNVFVLQPRISSFQHVQWEILHQFIFSSNIHCITWLHHHLLFTSKLSIHLYTTNGTCLYVTDVAKPISTLIPSPNQKAFASFGLHDRLLRIWIPEKQHKFTFVYLAHPRAVVHVVWEKGTDDLRVLTSAKDGLGRLWIWSDIAQVFQLYFTIEPPECHPTMSYHFINKYAIIDPLPKSQLQQSTKEVEPVPTSLVKRTHPELRSFLEQFDEIVFTVQGNASLHIWGISACPPPLLNILSLFTASYLTSIQNFGRRLGETTATLIKSLPNYVPLSHLDTFLNLTLVHHTHVPDTDHVLWIGYSKNTGSLTSFSVHMNAILYGPTPSCISIMRDLAGHVIQGPKSFYLLDASTFLSQSGPECIVWRLPIEERVQSSNYFTTTSLTFLYKIYQTDPTFFTFPLPQPLTLHREQKDSKFIDYNSASIRLVSFSTSEFHLSLIGASSFATYLLPHLSLVYSHSFNTSICAAFAMYPSIYDAVGIDETFNLSLFGRDGVLLHSECVAPFFSCSSSLPLSFRDILQLSLSCDTLACRTSTKVYIFAMRLFTHELYLQATLDLSVSFISLVVPKPGLALLATSVGSCLTVFANHLTYTSTSSIVTFHSIFERTFPSSIELFQWTYTMELVLFANHVLHHIALFPTLLSHSLHSTSCHFYHPIVLREWLMWNEIEKVECIFNHYYYSLKAGLATHVPLIPISYLFPDSASSSSAETQGKALEAFFDASVSEANPDILFSHEDLHVFSKEKMATLKDHFLAHKIDPIALPLLSILELLPELKAMALDDHGKRYFAELLYHYYLGDKQPSLLPPMSFDSFMFAYFSTSQTSLADFLHRSFTLTWLSAKSLGIGWWMTQLDALTTTIDIIAKNQWRQSSNPLDCFYFYLILPGKRKLLLHLWKQAHGHPEQHIMTQFLSQEVTEKWKKTALKNAFVLLGKQRFELAACFFLLAESYHDAVTVCLRNLNDPQLAFITCRLCQLPITAVVHFLHQKPPISTPGFSFLLDWMLDKKTFDIHWIQSPAMYLVYRSLQDLLSFLPPSNGEIEASSSTLPYSHQRQSLSKLLSYYKDRNWGHFYIYILHTLCAKTKDSARGASASDLLSSNLETGASSLEQVDDAFAALFGTIDKKETGDLFLTSKSSDPPLDTSMDLLLSVEEKNQLPILASQLMMWDCLQSNLDVFHCVDCKSMVYFKDYSSLIFSPKLDASLASRFCKWTLSPNHCLLFHEFSCDLSHIAFAHIVYSMYSTPLTVIKDTISEFPPELKLVMETLRSFANPELCSDFSTSSTALPIILLSAIYLFKFFRTYVNYGAMAILMKHFPSFFVPPLTSTLSIFYNELSSYFTTFSASASSHLVLEFLTCKMILNRLEVLYIESSKDSPMLETFLSDICFPLLRSFLYQLHYEMQVQETHVCSPSEDWLSSAQQELHAVLTYNPSWIQSLNASTSRPLDSLTPASNVSLSSSSSLSPLPSSEKPSKILAPAPSPPSFHSIHTLFKNEYPIFSMGVHTSDQILALALHKHVIELQLDPASIVQSTKATTASSVDITITTHSTNDSLQVPLSEPPHRAPEFNLLKKVHMPRSNSEHLNLTTIMNEPGFLLERPVFPVSIATHPNLNLYALAQYVDNKSSLSLYAFQVKEDQMPISHYGSAKIAKLLFDSTGSRLGIADGNGELGLFDVESWRLFYSLPCHVRYTSDLVFYQNDSLIATAGSSPGHINNVALWDTLMPMNYSKVRGYNIHESGSSAISSYGNYIVSGGKKGDLYVLDVRHTKPLFNIQSSHNCISALVIQGYHVFSGTTDGTLRVYDLASSALTEVACYKHLHQSKKLIATSLHQAPVSTLGITQILVKESYILTCGADGHVKWLH